MHIPDQQVNSKQKTLIGIKPELYWLLIKMQPVGIEQVSVEECRQGAKDIGKNHTYYPPVVAEVDTLFPAAAAEEIEGGDGDKHTYPLQQVEMLAKESESTDEHHDRTSGVDRPNDGDRQVLQSGISAYP